MLLSTILLGATDVAVVQSLSRILSLGFAVEEVVDEKDFFQLVGLNPWDFVAERHAESLNRASDTRIANNSIIVKLVSTPNFMVVLVRSSTLISIDTTNIPMTCLNRRKVSRAWAGRRIVVYLYDTVAALFFYTYVAMLIL